MKRILALLPLLAAGCLSNDDGELIEPVDQQVIINASHKHSTYCGHYRYGGRWYYVPRHVHGVNCDHDIIEGVWSLDD